jgi:dihydroflavonol-4-reductase
MIVVTGGTGLVGAHLLLKLLKENNSIRVIIREESSPKKVLAVWKHYIQDPEELLGRIDWYRGDITDKASIFDALQDADQVYHCAAEVTVDGTNKRRMFIINVLGTQNLVNICLAQNVKKLLHVSSIAAIGKSLNGTTLIETDGWPVKSKSIYTQTKTLAELEVWRGIAEGLNAVIVNPSVIIGPGNWESSSSRFFDVIYKGLKYYTKGITGFVDVNDVTEAMVQLMNGEISGERFILNSENISIQDFFNKIALSLNVRSPSRYASPFKTSMAWKIEYLKSFFTGKSPKISKQSARTSHSSRFYSGEKIVKQLNFEYTPQEESILKTAKFYLDERKGLSHF